MSPIYFLGMLALGLLLTIVLEGLIFLPLFVRRRSKTEIAAFVLVNVATNVALNLFLYLICVFTDMAAGFAFSAEEAFGIALGAAALLAEVLIVETEYFVLKKFIGEKKLFWFVLGANALSAVVGTALLALFTSM